MIIQTNQGLGDCIYLRPVLRWLVTKDIILKTPWPQAFIDFPNVKFIKPENCGLRTQTENVSRYRDWSMQHDIIDISLGQYDLRKNTIISYFCDKLLWEQPKWLDNRMAIPDEWFEAARNIIDTKNVKGKKVCLIRPNTLRNEWLCPARNPKTEYLQRFIDKYKDEFFIISLANLCNTQEIYEEKLVGIDMEITKDLPIEIVMGMFCLVNIVVTSPSFWVALGLALNTNMIVIYGAHEPHYAINDKRCDSKRCTIVQPNPFDVCDRVKTNAYKHIETKTLDSAFEEATQRC